MAQRNESLDRILVITPTYNEAENLAPIIKRLRDAVPSAHSLIADDNLRSQALAQRMGCTRDGSFTHETFGSSQIWRHPAPESLT